jgi:hypothetical protein
VSERKKEILSDDFKKRKIFWKNIAENFPPHITSIGAMSVGLNVTASIFKPK